MQTLPYTREAQSLLFKVARASKRLKAGQQRRTSEGHRAVRPLFLRIADLLVCPTAQSGAVELVGGQSLSHHYF